MCGLMSGLYSVPLIYFISLGFVVVVVVMVEVIVFLAFGILSRALVVFEYIHVPLLHDSDKVVNVV